jgi:hypothetical protein
MADDKRQFFEEYDGAVSDAAQAVYQQFNGELVRWLELVEHDDRTAAILASLGENLNRAAWIQRYGSPGMLVGDGGSITWPTGKEDRLGAQLDLFRIFARQEWDPIEFSLHALRSATTNLNAMTQNVVRQIFQPMARDLRRYLDQNWTIKPNAQIAPASDRIVRLDHNSDPYREAIESLNRVRDAVAAQNDYADEGDKGQRLAELDASKVLFAAPQVNLSVARALTVRTLKYLGEKFLEGTVHVLVEAALVALVALLGFHLLS